MSESPDTLLSFRFASPHGIGENDFSCMAAKTVESAGKLEAGGNLIA